VVGDHFDPQPKRSNTSLVVKMTIKLRVNMSVPVKKLTLMAILTAAALIIFIIEAQIPLPIPIPGVKLGLANAVTLFALFYGNMKRGDGPGAADISIAPDVATADISAAPTVANISATPDTPIAVSFTKRKLRPRVSVAASLTIANVFTILLCRIILGAVFTGRPIAFAYSIAGGLLGFAAQAVMKRFVTTKQIWVCGAIGAVFHNIGQILAAMLITGTPAIVVYLPVLVIAGVFTGVITGFIAQLTLTRIQM